MPGSYQGDPVLSSDIVEAQESMGGWMRRVRLVVVALLLVGMLVGATAPASTHGYTG